jgi:hypothetical protein
MLEMARTSDEMAQDGQEQPLSPCNGATLQLPSSSPRQQRHEAWKQCEHLASQPRILEVT